MRRTIDKSEIKNWEDRSRARLINGLSGAKSANLIGTQNTEGKTNLSIVSSCFHLGSNPALLGMIIRPATVPRHTFENILSTTTWTMNHVNSEISAAAHQTSARYPREVSEFKAVNLDPIYLNDFPAPFVEQANVRIGLRLADHIHIEINKTELLIGEIEFIDLPEDCILSDGHFDINAAGSVAISGLDEYHQLESIARYAYAKPNIPVKKVDKA